MSLYAFIYNIYLSIYIYIYHSISWLEARRGRSGECCGHVFFPPISRGSNSLQAKVFQCLRCLHGAGRLETCWCCCEFTPIETSQTIQTYPNISKLHSYIVDGQATPAHCEQSWTIWKFRTPFRLPIYEAHQLFNAGLDSLLELHTAVRCCVASILTMTRLRQWRSINICHMLFSYVPYG